MAVLDFLRNSNHGCLGSCDELEAGNWKLRLILLGPGLACKGNHWGLPLRKLFRS